MDAGLRSGFAAAERIVKVAETLEPRAAAREVYDAQYEVFKDAGFDGAVAQGYYPYSHFRSKT